MGNSLDWMNGMSYDEIRRSHREWSRQSDRIPLKCRTIRGAFLFDGYFKKFTIWTFLHFLFPIFKERNLAVCIRLQQLYWFKRLRLLEKIRKWRSRLGFFVWPICAFLYFRLAYLLATCSYLKSFLQKHYNSQVSPFADIGPGIVLNGNSNLQITALVRIGKDFHMGANNTLVSNNRGWPIVGANVTLWTNSVVVGKVRIGDHAIIGANAVVTKDIPAYATAVGVPARVIKINNPSLQTVSYDHSL